jgi:hypothetical protein
VPADTALSPDPLQVTVVEVDEPVVIEFDVALELT